MMAKTSRATRQDKKIEVVSQIAQAWAQVMAHNAKSHPERLPPDAPRFTDYAWRRFDAKTVMEVIIADKPTYRALKPILFSGLCTWAVCPKRNSLRQHGMLLVGIEHLRAAEVLGRAAFSDHEILGRDLLGDMFGRMLSLGADFYSDFYYPIGGLAQILRSTTPSNFAKSIRQHSEGAATIAATVEIYDFHARHLNDSKKYYRASESKGYELYRDLHLARNESAKIGTDYFRSCWADSKITAAMIYAASTIELTAGGSLLDVICNGEANFEEHGMLSRQWISRARYAADTVLGSMAKPELGLMNVEHLPKITPEMPSSLSFSSEEMAIIAAEFDRSALLGGRVKGVKRVRKSRR